MDTQTNTNLFKPLNRASIHLDNRIVMAPMTRSRAMNSIPNDMMATYYGQRASAGLIISEGTAPSPNGLGYSRIPGVYNERQTEGWKKITDAVHEKGGAIFMQMMHTGRVAHPDNLPEGARVLAPSALRADSSIWTDKSGMKTLPIPEAMSETEIERTIQEYAVAAENAIKAGFDGVELHGTSGYLLQQFLNPHSNIRSDSYGGSISNRIRFVKEVTEAVVHAIGKEKTGFRLSPYNSFNDMPVYNDQFETYKALVDELDKIGILYIHVIETSARKSEEGEELLRIMRETFRNLVIANGGYDRKKAEEALEESRADLISFGAPFISNPDLPRRLKNGIPLTPPDSKTFYSSGENGYTDYKYSYVGDSA